MKRSNSPRKKTCQQYNVSIPKTSSLVVMCTQITDRRNEFKSLPHNVAYIGI